MISQSFSCMSTHIESVRVFIFRALNVKSVQVKNLVLIDPESDLKSSVPLVKLVHNFMEYKIMEPLEIVPSEHVEHIEVKYKLLSVEDKRLKVKELKANKRTAANEARTAFDLGLELAEGKFKTLQSIYPKYVQAVGHTVREEKRSRVTDGKIEEYVVNMYTIDLDVTNVFKGVDVTDADAVKHLADIAKEDENLSEAELIVKYQVSIQLFFAKEAMKAASIHSRTINYARAKVLNSLHKLTIQTLEKMILEDEAKEHADKLVRMTKFITPEGRKKLFGF